MRNKAAAMVSSGITAYTLDDSRLTNGLKDSLDGNHAKSIFVAVDSVHAIAGNKLLYEKRYWTPSSSTALEPQGRPAVRH